MAARKGQTPLPHEDGLAYDGRYPEPVGSLAKEPWWICEQQPPWTGSAPVFP